MSRLDLKPCPFCGGEAVIETFTTAQERVPRFRVRCENKKCFAMTDWDYFKQEDAVTAWNRRADNEQTD